MFCTKCGIQIPDDIKFCPSCGTPVATNAPSPKPAKKILGKGALIGIIAGIAATVVLIVLFFSLSIFHIHSCMHHNSTKVNAQSQFETKVDTLLPNVFPMPLELDSPKSIVYHEYRSHPFGPFQSFSYTLLCQYDDAEYKAAKAALENRYRFRTELLDAGCVDDPENQLIEPYVEIGNNHFRFLYPRDEDAQAWGFYKRSILVVTNDVEHKIGYILFDDIDLDVAEDLTEFINEYCGWKYVRN